MSIWPYALGGAALAAGYFIGTAMLRMSAIEEMGILIDSGSSKDLLESRWGEDEFPDFFAAAWGTNGREFYKRLSRSLKDARYGRSRRLLQRLIRIEDEREGAKRSGAATDDAFREKALSALAAYRGRGGFESVLASFIERAYTERKHGDRG